MKKDKLTRKERQAAKRRADLKSSTRPLTAEQIRWDNLIMRMGEAERAIMRRNRHRSGW